LKPNDGDHHERQQNDNQDREVIHSPPSAQCRGGRAMARLSTAELASSARVGVATINRFELNQASSNHATLAAIQRALEAAGVEFLPDNGVRLKTTQVSHSGDGGQDGGGSRKPASAESSPAARPRKPAAPSRKAEPAAPLSKEAQIRALREQGAR
jgi:transcriptional regulator with XRE-family HTH domain